MKVQEISKIENAGLFTKVDWNTNEPFKNSNLIFGWNGTGKTTLSRIYRSYELSVPSEQIKDSQYSLLVDSKKYTQNDLGKITNFRVFNKDFVQENLFQDNIKEGRGINPIFYLGDEKITLEKERSEKSEKEVLLKNKADARDDLIKTIEKNEEKNAKHIKDTFFGIEKYRFYHKTNYKTDLESIARKIKEGHLLESFIFTETEFDKQLKLVKENTNETISFDFINKKLLDDLESNYLQKEIRVSEIIESLKSDPVLSGWVEQGIHHHEDSAVCNFCNQNLPENRIDQLKKHFDKSYQDFQKKIANVIIELESKKDANNIIHELIHKLKSKQKDVFSRVNFTKEEKEALLAKVEEFSLGQKETDEKIETLMESLVAFDYTAHLDLNNSLLKIKDEISHLETEINKLGELIKSREKDREDFQLPVDELNSDIEFLLGHKEIVFKVVKELIKYEDGTEKEEVYYQIERNGDIAHYLSESEKTAISLIYFFKKIKNAGEDISKLVLFIDDPISSMDSRLLFSAYAYIISNLSDENNNLLVKQFIIATHNYDFFNLLKKKYGNSGFYMLDIDFIDNRRCATIKPLDPLLRNNDSDYQYLFRKLVEYTEFSDDKKRNLANIYPYPNIGRRVLESFFSFKHPQCNLRDAIYKCKSLSMKEKESLYEFLQNRSHDKSQEALRTFSAGHLEPGVIEENIKRILYEILKVEDEPHFNGLMEKIN